MEDIADIPSMQGLSWNRIPHTNPVESLSSDREASFGSNIEDIVRCFICFERVRNPFLCPRCSKIGCHGCLTRWLTENKCQCPHCREPLMVNELVNARFMDEIFSELSRLDKENRKPIVSSKNQNTEMCTLHQDTAKTYYCETCLDSICSDCAMFGTTHKGHSFSRLSEVYESHVSLINTEMASIEARLRTLDSMDKSLEAKVEFVKGCKAEKEAELEKFIKGTEMNLERNLQEMLVELLNKRKDILKESRLLESLVAELQSQMDIKLCNRTSLIKKSNDLILMLKEIHTNPLPNCQELCAIPDATNPPLFPSEICPEYTSHMYILDAFSDKQAQEQVIYSSGLYIHGRVFKLKLYPHGNGANSGRFISVFLELVDDITDVNDEKFDFDYRIELIHSKQERLNISRVFKSTFQKGECWGYSRFYRLNDLRSEGYLMNDQLKLRFGIRYPTYKACSISQNQYISFLEGKQQIYIQQHTQRHNPQEINNNTVITSSREEEKICLFDYDHERVPGEQDIKQEQESSSFKSGSLDSELIFAISTSCSDDSDSAYATSDDDVAEDDEEDDEASSSATSDDDDIEEGEEDDEEDSDEVVL